MDMMGGLVLAAMGIGIFIAIMYVAMYLQIPLKYTRYLQAYKLKVLFEELKKRKVSIEELKKIMDGKKIHELDFIEEEVKGEFEKAVTDK
jgi:hypothetical protein